MKLGSLTPISADKKKERKKERAMWTVSPSFFPLKLTHFYLHFPLIIIIIVVVVVVVVVVGIGGGGGGGGGAGKFESVLD
jgi:hypothetical protein